MRNLITTRDHFVRLNVIRRSNVDIIALAASAACQIHQRQTIKGVLNWQQIIADVVDLMRIIVYIVCFNEILKYKIFFYLLEVNNSTSCTPLCH